MVILENYSALRFEHLKLREKVRMLLYQLVVAGNSCYRIPKNEAAIELFPIEDWVCVRNSHGDLLELIIREYLEDSESENGYSKMYTRCVLTGDKWEVSRWTTDEQVGTTLVYTKENFEYHVPTWELTIGEHYGQGLCEENLGDIRTYETGTQKVNEAVSALAKVVFTVRPNGTTDAQDVIEAANTDVISGDAEDVGVIQASKLYDLSGFIQFLSGIKQELDMSFMMPSVIRRDGERVTAEEIRRMAAEFEKAKGGVYNSLSNGIQQPIAQLLIRDMFKTTDLLGDLWISDIVPVIVTGLDGLGRSLELDNLRAWLADLASLPGGLERLNMEEVSKKLGLLRNLEVGDMLKGNAQLAQEQQQAQIDQMVQQAAPHMMGNAVKGAQ